MLLLLLSCSPKVQTIALSPVASCRSQVLPQTLPGLWVQDVEVLEGEIPVRVLHKQIELRLQPTERKQDSVLVEYSAGPFHVRRRARIQVPRTPLPKLLPPEPPSWRLRFEGAQLGSQALAKSNLLGTEQEVELLLEVCPEHIPCLTLVPNGELWGSAPSLSEPSFRIRDEDLLFKQRLTPKAAARLQPGPNTLVLGDSTAQVHVQATAHPTLDPDPLVLGQPVKGVLSRQKGYPHAYILHLDEPQSVTLAISGSQHGLDLGLHRCDGTPVQSVRNVERRAAVMQLRLDAGDWLIRAGLPETGVIQNHYALLATTSSQELEDFVRGQGSN